MTRASANQSRCVRGRTPNAYGATMHITIRIRNHVENERMRLLI
jgi:hypothetical protein